MLNPQVFEQLQQTMGPLHIDLFASQLTKQLPMFYSWRPDLEAQHSIKIGLRGRYLSQIKRQVARVVMIIPLWASQSWYPLILEMLEDYPRILPAQEDLVMLQAEEDFIMSQRVPTLVAWPISGDPIHHKEFLQKLENFSLHPGDLRLDQTTIHCLQSGLAGVDQGIEIPLLDL